MNVTNKYIDFNVASYNALVKSNYMIDAASMSYLISNEVSEDDSCTPYHEIPSYMTISGHAEIFEPAE